MCKQKALNFAFRKILSHYYLVLVDGSPQRNGRMRGSRGGALLPGDKIVRGMCAYICTRMNGLENLSHSHMLPVMSFSGRSRVRGGQWVPQGRARQSTLSAVNRARVSSICFPMHVLDLLHTCTQLILWLPVTFDWPFCSRTEFLSCSNVGIPVAYF